MKIAIIGSGISGLASAYYLSKEHSVTLFEKNNYIGGHTATHEFTLDNKSYRIDTGFIVFNDRTYPHFNNFLKDLNIEGLDTEMSFSVSNPRYDLEYNGHSFLSLFAQKKNFFNLKFYKFLYEIIRFNKIAKKYVNNEMLENFSDDYLLSELLKKYKFSEYFCQNYLLPMGSAIWSSSLDDIKNFPVKFFVKFFNNHGLLDINNRPQWKVIPNGSKYYIEKIFENCNFEVRLNEPVIAVERYSNHCAIEISNEILNYDKVIFASHSDETLKLIKNPTPEEKNILEQIKYKENEVVLHYDLNMLPKTKQAWASWNYRFNKDHLTDQLPSVTYNMNILQRLEDKMTFCVTLNDTKSIDKSKIINSFVYSHPIFNESTVKAQGLRSKINGKNNCYFCGAYWYNGFHEDGIRSALDIVSLLNGTKYGK